MTLQTITELSIYPNVGKKVIEIGISLNLLSFSLLLHL
jgi:hypothetical protein